MIIPFFAPLMLVGALGIGAVEAPDLDALTSEDVAANTQTEVVVPAHTPPAFGDDDDYGSILNDLR